MKERIANVFKKVFGLGQFCITVLTLVIICAYIVAFVIGGETAVAIEAYIYTNIFPKMYFTVVALAFVGVVYLYLTGYRTMRFESKGEH